MAAVEWRRIYEYPFTQQSHAFVDGHGCCGVARRDSARMKRTLAPSALDTCTACGKWLRTSNHTEKIDAT